MDTENKSIEDNKSKECELDEIANLENDIAELNGKINASMNDSINAGSKYEEINKEETANASDFNYTDQTNNIKREENEVNDNYDFENPQEYNIKNSTLINDNINEKKNMEEGNEIHINDTSENNYKDKENNKSNENNVNNGISNFNNTDKNVCDEINADNQDNEKMQIKIKNLLKLIEILKDQINQKDQELYQIEVDMKMRNGKNEDSLSIEDDGISEKKENNIFINKMKKILISQNDEIILLNEELKKKNKEIFYLNEENIIKDEKLIELKKEIEENYLHLKEYKNMQSMMQMDANNKIYSAESYLSATNKKLLENNIDIKEKKLNIEKQKKVIKELYNQLNKKDDQIIELRRVIESVELNNNRDIIKYKENNIDLINRLRLNASLMNSQKIEIENMHINYKQLEEELRNKDNELKKLHNNILTKDDENNKIIQDMNRLKFDMEIKNIDLLNIKKKIKGIKKEYSINLQKQKDRFTDVINEIYKEKDEIIKKHAEEISKLVSHYNEVVCINDNLKNEINTLKDEILKKECEIEKLQDRLIDYEAKLLVYENNSEVKMLKKNEDHLSMLLNKHMRKNEELVNTNFLLQKSTLENNNLEEKILELRGTIYRKDHEIKSLHEQNRKKKNSSSNSNADKHILEIYSEVNNDNISIKNGDNINDINNSYSDEVCSAYAPRKVSEKNNRSVIIQNENINPQLNDTPNTVEDDPIYATLCDLLNCNKENNSLFKINKICDKTYMINDKKVFINFINGELYAENDGYPVKLQDYLAQILEY
ncbi:conserved Plasmodium protein, unknown function [Plasmodium chabaudi chabaudi]|uniref:Uncharacterized protein n=1 Tax=Plasmodium chabaudi chabaudi TaxID=31271 RepID=A0A4V0KDZ8_PLACU|nr:conserved Plasmodium protein, unknown function [Plasmodium chabaudi chabaudi]VTZ71121.1 conserved Plasmodium protein, unknown function [Plasmodium chabaudi chabaudi]|eukprot:XP_016654995.1 conserved Plasmodium protein, unknown function [Plasmodium chabaudi chabaudi]